MVEKPKWKEYDDIVEETAKKAIHDNTVATPKKIVDNIL